MVRVSRGVSFAVAVSVLAGCGAGKVDPVLDLTARPRSIDNLGGKTVITATAIDAASKAGTGTVKVSSSAGSLSAGEELTLKDGEVTVDFTCEIAKDTACLGAITITAEWTSGSTKVTDTAQVTVGPDSGTPDAGHQTVDAGAELDAGFDIGTVDGGTFGEYTISLAFEKSVLLRATGDSMTVTAHVTKTATPNVGVQGASVIFTAPGGASFAQTAMSSKSVATNAAGDAAVTLYVGSATASILVTAASFDATAFVGVSVVNVANIQWVNDPRTKPQLTVRSTGRDSSTPVFFKVTDASTQPVRGVLVLFDIGAGSAAGCTVTNSSMTDIDGIAQTSLSSGDANGNVTVRAIVSATSGQSNEKLANRDFKVIIGRPSDSQFSLQCTRKVLGALQNSENKPRDDLSTPCTATLADRFSTVVPFDLDVSWGAEVGLVDATSKADPASGKAINTYRTGTNFPREVEPFVGEPRDGTRNPRDMFVTVIAHVSGEEQFWDREQPGGGVGNGVWDPGEWFVDLPEPYIDANDNGIFDSDETFFDTERINCSTGQKEEKNRTWDGPNGCWDATTVIWRSTRIIYAGNPSNGTGTTDGPFLTYNPPSTIPNNMQTSQTFTWYDAYYNRISNDSPSVSIAIVQGNRGAVAVTFLNSGEAFGHNLTDPVVRGTYSGGVVTEEGGCEFADRATPPPVGTRCFRTFKVTDWRTQPLGGNILLTGPAPAGSPIDNTSLIYQLVGGNTLANPTRSRQFTSNYPQ